MATLIENQTAENFPRADFNGFGPSLIDPANSRSNQTQHSATGPPGGPQDAAGALPAYARSTGG